MIASLHTSFDKNPTERVLGAMENPHVDCIGHLTGRKIGKRAGAAVDVERVIEKAVETGTVLEIDSQPDRLDMPDFVARLAGEAGVPIAVTSDAHRLSALAYVELGVGQARRAWLTKQQVLNTRTWPQIAKLRAMSFREDGQAAVEWAARYLEQVGDYPVLAQVEPGEMRAQLPPSPPERGRAVRGRAARPRRAAAAGDDALAAPALLRLLRRTPPRSRAILAELLDRRAEPGRRSSGAPRRR